MKIFFGKISSKEQFKDQIEKGYYKTSNQEMFNGIDVGDYAFIVAGGRIQLWQATSWSDNKGRLDFDILISNTGLNTKDLSAFRYFYLDIPLVVLTVRQTSKRAFFPINFSEELSEPQLRNPETYKDKKNFRNIVLIDKEADLDKTNYNIYIYKREKISYASAKNSGNVFSNFSDNTKYIGSGQKNKDTVLKKLSNINQFPKVFAPSELSILQLYDAFCCDYRIVSHEEETGTELTETDIFNPYVSSKNIILYGPPGTGKTYNTINTAVKIIEPEYYQKYASDRTKLNEKYKELKDKGKVDFVTFHQSFGYEEFVEGIKPIPPMTADNESDQMTYDIEDGIFKRICDSARSVGRSVNTFSLDDFNGKYYKISLGGKQRPHIHDWCINENYVAMGWGGDQDLSSLAKQHDWKKFRDEYKKQFPQFAEEGRFHIQAAFIFCRMKKGDIVIASKGNLIVDAIGILEDDNYIYKEDAPFEFYHFRKVKWLATNLNKPAELFSKKNLSQQSIYEFYDADIKKEYIESLLSNDEKVESKSHVLIIDEINRGNISKIFGELITLLEPDKRAGEENEIIVRLPYSKKEFSVPSNLYIIGTMNTADRSIALIDTALRRRFEFREMLPDPGLLKSSNLLVNLWTKFELIDWDDPFEEKESHLLSLIGATEYNEDTWERIWSEIKDLSLLDYSEYFEEINFEGVNLSRLLSTLNQRIEFLFDRDHTIGHAYFIKINSLFDLCEVFRLRVIPLLQEYFYNDWEKIQLVLGENNGWKKVNDFRFIHEKKSSETALFGEDLEDYEDKKLFTLNDKFISGNYEDVTNEAFIRIYEKPTDS